MVCTYDTTESLMISPYTIVALEIVRSRGLFGRVTVLYEVTNNATDGMYLETFVTILTLLYCL